MEENLSREEIEEILNDDNIVEEKYERGKKAYHKTKNIIPKAIKCEKCGTRMNLLNKLGHYICEHCFAKLIEEVKRRNIVQPKIDYERIMTNMVNEIFRKK